MLGQKIGHYEITAKLGQGGMGEVYRARDTRLNRDVALKLLPAIFANDEQRMGRFSREAQVLASLNHPNIASIYGLEESRNQRVLVMELVEGEDLSERIARGRIPLEEALAIARQVTGALEDAHERGIIHRDLKPANIKLTSDGKVKVLDFGLAKALEDPAANAQPEGLSRSPTLSMAATQAGVILGTAAYMSPEQARGKPVDKRTDIWSFGVVLYEMVTGTRPFQGEDLTETLASVVKDEPNLSEAPRKVQRLLGDCLRKDPKNRLRDIGDAWRLLQEPGVAVVAASAPSRLGWLPWSVAVMGVSAAIALAFFHFREAAPELHSYAYTIPPPPNTVVHSFAISPNGTRVAIAARAGAQTSLWVRDLDSFEPRELSGTAGAVFPFWSPDGRHIGFAAGLERKKILADGGPVTEIASGGGIPTGTWNQDGVILSQGHSGGIFRANASGGAYSALLESTLVLGYPFFLPDGRRFLYTVMQGPEDKRGIYAASLDSTETQRLLPDNGSSVYDPPRPGTSTGYVIFVRDGSLVAQPVDDSTLRPAGELMEIAERANTLPGTFSVSTNGVLLYKMAESSLTRLTWMDRSGTELSTVREPAAILDFALSPDDKHIVWERQDLTGFSDLWMYDSERKMATRFTTVANSRSSRPVWSPDGTSVTFSSNRAGRTDLYQKVVASAVPGQALYTTEDSLKLGFDWTRDGKFLLFVEWTGDEEGYNICALPSDGGKPVPVVQGKFSQSKPQLSPDNRWLAYVSNESGRNEVYVEPFSLEGKPAQKRWQISADGGTHPRWRGDGRELFFLAADQKLMSVAIEPTSDKAGAAVFSFDSPQSLFALTPPNAITLGPWDNRYPYEVTADGKRFLVLKESGDSTPTPIAVLTNWQAELEK